MEIIFKKKKRSKWDEDPMAVYYCKAKKVIRSYTQVQEFVDDFPSYAVTRKIENPKLPWRYLISEFFRDKLGRPVEYARQNPIDLLNATNNNYSPDYLPADNGDIDDHIDYLMILQQARFARLSQDEYNMLIMVYLHGALQRDAAAFIGHSESRGAQILKRSLDKVLSHLRRQELGRRFRSSMK